MSYQFTARNDPLAVDTLEQVLETSQPFCTTIINAENEPLPNNIQV